MKWGHRTKRESWNNPPGIVPTPGWGATSHWEEADTPAPDNPTLATSLHQAVLVMETYLEIQCNADHKVPENCQESADQVFL